MKIKASFISLGVLLNASFQITAQIVSPQVLPTAGAVLQGGGVTLSSTIGQTFTQTLTVGNEIYTLGFQQPEIGSPTGLAPQSACSDTAFTFTFSGVTAGIGGNQIEWATNSSFSGSTIVSSPANINITVSAGAIDTIYIRSRVSGTNWVSAQVMTVVTNHADPSATASNSGPYCSYGTISLTGGPSSMSSYSWAGPNSFSSTSQSPTRSAIGNGGTYTLTVTNSNGCSATSSTSVTVNTTPAANAGFDIFICHGSSAVIGGIPAAIGGHTPYTYSWKPSSNLTDSVIANPTCNTTSNRNYILNVTDSNGCTATDTMLVTVWSLPVAHAGNDTSICPGSSVVLGNSIAATGGNGFYYYRWSYPQFLNNANYPNPIATPTNTTAFVLKVTDGNDCIAQDTQNIVIRSSPVANAGDDITICKGSSATLGGSSTSGYSYLWSNSNLLNSDTVANPVATPAFTTAFALTVTDINGCTNTGTVNVNLYPVIDNPAPVFIYAPTVACKHATVCYEAEANNSNRILYSLLNGAASIDTNTGCVNNVLSNFTIRATAYYPCFSTNTDLEVTMAPIISTSPTDTTIWVGDTVILQALGGYNIHWLTPINTSATTIKASPGSDSTAYMVKVTDYYGCSDTTFAIVRATDTLTLSVIKSRDTVYMFDTTRIIAKANLPNTSISWARNKLDTITGPSSDTTGIISDLFVNTLSVEQNVCFDFTAINNGHTTNKRATIGLGALPRGSITLSNISNTLTACVDTATITATLVNCDSLIDTGFLFIQHFPLGTHIIADSASCTGVATPIISNSDTATNVIWKIPENISTSCTLTVSFVLGCSQSSGNKITSSTNPENITSTTDALLVISYPTIDIISPTPDITYELVGQTALTRTWQVCATDGKVDNLILIYTPESEIENVYLDIFNGNHHFYSSPHLLSGSSSYTIYIPPSDSTAPNMKTLFPIVGYMDAGQCITIKDSFDIKECTDTPSVTFLQAYFNCGATADTCVSSNLTQSANVIVKDDYDNIYNVDNSPIYFDSLQILQNNLNVTSTGAIPCASDTITLNYVFKNPRRSNLLLPPNANYKKLEDFTTYINSCLLNGPMTVTVTICDSSNTCTTTQPTVTDANNILYVSLQDSLLNENSTLIISVRGLTFNPACDYLNSCSLYFMADIIANPTLNYSTMCGHNLSIINSTVNYINDIHEEIDNGNQFSLPADDAEAGGTNTINFCMEQYSGSGNPWSFSNGTESFLHCTSLSYEIVLTLPTKPLFTISSISYTPTDGDTSIPIPSGSILSNGNNTYTIVSSIIQNSGCLNVTVLFNGDSCNSPAGHSIFSAQLYAVCGTGMCGTDSLKYCMGIFTDSLSYHCHGFCDSTGIGTDSGVIVQRIPINSEHIAGTGPADLTRAYPWDTIEIIARGEGFSSAGYHGSDVFMHLTYGSDAGSSSLLFKPISATFSVDSGSGFNSWQPVDTIVGPYMVDTTGIVMDVHLPKGCGSSIQQSVSGYIIDSSKNFQVKLLLQVAYDIPADFDNGISDVQLQADMSFYACSDTADIRHHSCDPYSASIELIQHSYFPQVKFIQPNDPAFPLTGDICTQRLLISTEADGGRADVDEMPNEVRPLIVWPDSAHALTITNLGTNIEMTGASFDKYSPSVSGPVPICSNMATPPCFTQTMGTATIYGDSSGTGWPQFGKNMDHTTYIMLLMVDLDKKTCPDDSATVDVNLNYWTRGMSDTVYTPTEYFSQPGGRAPFAATTIQTNAPAQLLTWDSIYDGYIDDATYVPEANSFSFNSTLNYRGKDNALYTWIYPILPSQILSLKLGGNSMFDSSYTSSGPIIVPPGIDNLTFQVVIDSNNCNPGIYSIVFYSGYTCNPVSPPTNDTPNVTYPPNIDSLYTCGFEKSTVQFNIVPPEINTDGSDLDTSYPDYCIPITLSFDITASGNAIYSPNCQIGVPYLSYLMGVYYTISCGDSGHRYPETGSISLNIDGYPTRTGYNCQSDIDSFLKLENLPYLPQGCTLIVHATFSTYDTISASNDTSGHLPVSGLVSPGFYATGQNRCGQNLLGVFVTGGINYHQDPFYYKQLESTNCVFPGSIIASIENTYPGFIYSWSNGIKDTTDNPADTISIITSDTYNLTVTDANGCTFTPASPITVTLDYPIFASFTIIDDSCHGENYGKINLTPSGGTPGYTFLWNGGDTSQNRIDLATDTFNVTITDAVKCTLDTSAVITQPAVLSIDSVHSTNVSCYNGSNGKITLFVTGGTYLYRYAWTNTSATDSALTGLSKNTYTVVVTDAHGCMTAKSDTITQPLTAINLSTNTGGTCSTLNVGFIDLTATGGDSPYTFDWGAGIATQNRQGLAEGTYTVTITDANGCTSSISNAISTSNSPCCVPDNTTGGPAFTPALPPGVTNDDLTFGSLTSTELLTKISTLFQGQYVSGTTLSIPYHITINGTLQLDSDLTIAGAGMRFGEGASVYVPNLHTLNIISILSSACSDYLWKGVILEEAPEGVPPSPGAFFSSKLVMSNGAINDAQYGILANNGSVIYIYNSSFSNNFIGCYFRGKSPIGGIYNNLFSGNGFSGGTILQPYRYPAAMQNTSVQPSASDVGTYLTSWAGVELDSIGYFDFGYYGTSNTGCDYQYASNHSFSQLANGIVAINSSFDAGLCSFGDISNTYGYTNTNDSLQLQGMKWPLSGNAILARGLYGIGSRTLRYSGLNTGGPFVSPCNYTDFNNCQYGIITDNMAVDIQACQMAGGEGGVRIFNSPSTVANVYQNSISVSGTGIWAYHQGADKNHSFTQNINIYEDSITTQNKGIVFTDYGGGPQSESSSAIYNNYINTSGSVGIWALNGFNLISSQNTVNLQQPTANFYGIWYNNCQNLQDEYNYVHSTGTTANSTNDTLPAGIESDLCFGSSGLTYDPVVHSCNSITNINTDMRFKYANSNASIQSNHFNYNSEPGVNAPTGTSNIGLSVDNADNLDNQYDKANKWYASYGTGSGQAGAVSSAPPTYEQFTTSTTTTDFPPTSFPSTGWFKELATLPFVDTCNFTAYPPPTLLPPDSGLTPYERAVILDSVDFGNFNVELNWQKKKIIYEKLLNDTMLIDSNYVRTFYDTTATNVMGVLVKMDALIQTAVAHDSGTALRLQALQDSVTSTMQQLVSMDSLRVALAHADSIRKAIEIDEAFSRDYTYILVVLTDDGELPYVNIDSIYINLYYSVADSFATYINVTDTGAWDTVNTKYYSTLSAVTSFTQMHDSLMQVFATARNLQIATTIDSNSTITPGLDIEQAFQQVNDIYLNTVAQDNPQFDSSQLATLYQLAFECPMQGGEAVYRARGLLAAVVDTFYLDDNLCSSDTFLRMAKVHKKDTLSPLQVRLYPNPARDYAILQLNQDITPLQLKIMDGMGRLIINQAIVTNGGLYIINTSSFISGLYYVALYSNEGKIYGGKLSIFMK